MTTGAGKIWQSETIPTMKLKSGFLLFLLAALVASAQTNNLTALLQQGLMEEQANRNLDAAIANYQSLALQFDKDRQVAATAVFRLGELQSTFNNACKRSLPRLRQMRPRCRPMGKDGKFNASSK